MTQDSRDHTDLQFCELCQTTSSKNPEFFEDNFILCDQGHKLFPAKCDSCKTTWEGFVKEENRILCLCCYYPVQVFEQPSSSNVSEPGRIFEEAPGFLICSCCEQFELDLFTLLPIDDKHVYFQCMNCKLEMIVASKSAPPGLRSRIRSRFRLNGNRSDFPEGFDKSFLTSQLSESEFNRVLEVSKNRMCVLDDALKTRLVGDATNDERPVPRSRTLTGLIESLLANESFRVNVRNAVKKVPSVSSALLGLIVAAQVKNPSVAKAITVGSQAVIQVICDIILGALDNHCEKLGKEREN